MSHYHALKRGKRSESALMRVVDGRIVDSIQDCELLFEAIYASVGKLWKNFEDIRKKIGHLSAIKDTLEKDVLSSQQQSVQLQKHLEVLKKDVNSETNRRGRSQQAAVTKKRQNKTKINMENVVVGSKLAPTGGSCAAIYSCWVDGWQCVMKELNLTENTETSIGAFVKEITILEQLPVHPNICRYLFHYTTETYLRLFMTRYDCTLRSFIGNRQIRFEAGEIRNFALEISRGLSFLHSQGIIHRDLKSENVFISLDRAKNPQTIAIGDFDTAKDLCKTKRPTSCIGTPQYMAPEVFHSANQKSYSFSSDVYSFGMVLYEIMSLTPPYHGLSLTKLNQMMSAGEKPELPADLEKSYQPFVELYHRVIESEPTKRPTSQELVQIFSPEDNDPVQDETNLDAVRQNKINLLSIVKRSAGRGKRFIKHRRNVSHDEHIGDVKILPATLETLIQYELPLNTTPDDSPHHTPTETPSPSPPISPRKNPKSASTPEPTTDTGDPLDDPVAMSEIIPTPFNTIPRTACPSAFACPASSPPKLGRQRQKNLTILAKPILISPTTEAP